MSRSTFAVLRVLAEGAQYGFDIMDATGLASGTVYPILSRLESRGLASSRWEDPEVHQREGRPARKYYRITVEGRRSFAAELERFRELTRPLPAEA